jgi:hypothetical protein
VTQLANAVRHLWQWPAPELGLRTTTDLLLANVMLLRAGNRVDIELRDMISRHRLAVLALGRRHAVGKDQQDREGPAAGRRGPLSLLAIVSVLYSACLLGHWQIPPSHLQAFLCGSSWLCMYMYCPSLEREPAFYSRKRAYLLSS